jgi:Bacteriophage T4-like portal protein (Gp20)
MGLIRANQHGPSPVMYETMPDGLVRTTYSNGNRLVVNPAMVGIDPRVAAMMRSAGDSFKRATGDSGPVGYFRPALYTKPQGPIQRIQGAWNGFMGRPTGIQTTEQGASSAASPVTYYLSLWTQLFGRRARIDDTRSLFLTDPRVWRSVNMYSDRAMKGGPRIRIQGNDARAKVAREIAEDFQRIFTEALVSEWARGILLEGDLFVQHVMDARRGRLEPIDAVAMPGVAMLRQTDDADRFIDKEHAFEQIDSMTLQTVTTFSESLMTHSRWAKVNGDRYGTSEIVCARRMIRALELMEQAVVINRMARAALRRFHSVGVPGNTGSWDEVKNYKLENGLFEGNQEAFNPKTVMMDYYGNGNTNVQTLAGDPNIGEIKDLEYIQAVLMAALPTPGPFFGLQIEEAKRDVLEDMKRLWVDSFGKLQNAIGEPLSHWFRLALTMRDIDPALVKFRVAWQRGALETVIETVEWVGAAREAGVMSQEAGTQELAEIIGTDSGEEMKLLKAEGEQQHAEAIEQRTAGSSLRERMNDEEPKAKKPAAKSKQPPARPARKRTPSTE